MFVSLLSDLRSEITLGAVISFFIGAVVGALITFPINLYLTEISKKPDIDFQMGIFDKDETGFYFPLKITNNGEKNLNDIEIRYLNCYMPNPIVHKISTLAVSGTDVFKLRDEKTIEYYRKKPLTPYSDYSDPNASKCWIQLYVYNKSILYAPDQNCSIFIGGFCDYNVSIVSKEINKPFSDHFYAPIESVFHVYSNEDIKIGNLSLVEKYPTPIGVIIVPPEERRAMKTGEVPEKVPEYYFPPITLSAYNKVYNTSINVTISPLGLKIPN